MKIIEESKYLGGDMEHTHLVKGLDYALLDKVRAEINIKETQDEDLEAVADEDIEMQSVSRVDLLYVGVSNASQVAFKNSRSICVLHTYTSYSAAHMYS